MLSRRIYPGGEPESQSYKLEKAGWKTEIPAADYRDVHHVLCKGRYDVGDRQLTPEYTPNKPIRRHEVPA